MGGRCTGLATRGVGVTRSQETASGGGLVDRSRPTEGVMAGRTDWFEGAFPWSRPWCYCLWVRC